MACVENIPPGKEDSEMEEGEIVDDLDDLSDISSEEEFLLRQRLQVLENYNNVLERKKAKRSSFGPGTKRKEHFLQDLSEISGSELDDKAPSNVISKASVIVYRNVKDHRHLKTYKQKKRKEAESHSLTRHKDSKKKTHRKKRLEVKVVSETSEESDDEYRNKRRKLAAAVNKNTCDTSSLQARLQKMLCGTNSLETLKSDLILTKDQQTETEKTLKDVSCSPMIPKQNEKPNSIEEISKTTQLSVIDLSTDDDVTIVSNNEKSQDTVDAVTKEKPVEENKKGSEGDSDEDLELLRQHALKTKVSKTKEVQTSVPVESENKPLILTEDEDSDTEELRMICLKSALLKKAIEMKQKQKLNKRLSQSSNLKDDLLDEENEFVNKTESQDNTDIESVDMDIGSDADEKTKDLSNDSAKVEDMERFDIGNKESLKKVVEKTCAPKVDEIEEDEDLLRAQLLTSLSKNLPNLIDHHLFEALDDAKTTEIVAPTTKPQVPNIPEKRIIINLGESDSEGEHEATKNLTKMHMKLSEQKEFQQKLDMFLKSARMEVEKEKLPDVVQQPLPPKTPQKFVAKAVNHLPKPEQIEYKNLVKRMAELEKIKQARQSSMTVVNKTQIKETLKVRNVPVEQTQQTGLNNLEEQIALSRKKIADESAKIMKLKEEAMKLSQKYKIVATELRNISTAITLNKKEQRSVHNRLSKIRIQHQRLLQSSTSIHSKANGHPLSITRPNNKSLSTNKLQKENNPKEDYKNPNITRTVKVSVPNDTKETVPNPVLSVQVDFCNNKKTVKMPSPVKTRVVDIQKDSPENDVLDHDENSKECNSLPVADIIWGKRCEERCERRKEFDDYESPLQAFETASWLADPNAILCPFEVGGNCKDPDCKYLHPKIPSKQ